MKELFDSRSELLEFIDKKALDPVLEAIPEQYSSERDRRLLKNIQRRAAMEKRLFHDKHLSAVQVKRKFLREIYFEVHNNFGKQLEDLELPRFRQFGRQFLLLCDNLQVI